MSPSLKQSQRRENGFIILAVTNDDSFTSVGPTFPEHIAVGNPNNAGLLLPREKAEDD